MPEGGILVPLEASLHTQDETMPDPLSFAKYHAHGNDYLVIDPVRTPFDPKPQLIQTLCDRHRGLGSDGILLGPLAVPGEAGVIGLRIFNPDGSLVQVNMGRPSFQAVDIPFTGIDAQLEVLKAPLNLPSGPVTITAVRVGNPHCVRFPRQVSRALARRLGPQIERHTAFPNQVNIQFVQVVHRRSIRLEIRERGAGYTLASCRLRRSRSLQEARLGRGRPHRSHARRIPRDSVHPGGSHPHDGAGPARLHWPLAPRPRPASSPAP